MLKDKIKKLRIDKKLTQEELANMLYVSRPTISKWELGKLYPSKQSLQDLCNLFEVKEEYLLDYNDISNATELVNKQNKISIKILFASITIILVLLLVFIAFLNIVKNPNHYYKNLEIYSINFGTYKAEVTTIEDLMISHVTILDEKEKFKDSLKKNRAYICDFIMKETTLYNEKTYKDFIGNNCYLFRYEFSGRKNDVLVVEVGSGEYSFLSLDNKVACVYGNTIENEFNIYNEPFRYGWYIEQYLIKQNQRNYEINIEYEPTYSFEELQKIYKLKYGSTNIFEIPRVRPQYNNYLGLQELPVKLDNNVYLYLEYLENGNIKFIM